MKPYPGFPPNFTALDKVDNLHRTCYVLEFLSTVPLESAQIAMIEEQMSALAARLSKKVRNVKKVDFVHPDRFDRKLLDGLRLTRK